MWEFISGIKPPQKRKTDEDNNSYCYKYLKSLYYLIKCVFKMNDYSFIYECFDFSFSLTEKQNWALRNLAGPLEIRSQ
jgi:hypothetical protein